MHPTAMSNAFRFVSNYLQGQAGLKVLDVGGADVNGGLRELFEAAGHSYKALDIREAAGVDIVAKEGEPFPIESSSFDAVVSTSMLEHDPAFWVTFNEMVRVCASGGYIYINAPSSGAHHWDRDCWRFLIDAFPALAKWSGKVQLVENYIDGNSSWRDCVGVFKKD